MRKEFKNKRIESIAKAHDKLLLFVFTPMTAETKEKLIKTFPILADDRKISPRDLWIFMVMILGGSHIIMKVFA